MIDESGWIPLRVSVEIELFVQEKNAFIAQFASAVRFAFIDLFTGVFDEPRSSVEPRPGKRADSVNRRRLEENVFVIKNHCGSILATARLESIRGLAVGFILQHQAAPILSKARVPLNEIKFAQSFESSQAADLDVG